jgi:hypothetical protein
MKRLSIGLLLAASAVLVAVTTPVFAQSSPRAYTEGPVVAVSYIRTEPGKFDDYLQYLGTTYKKAMEEQKKAGVVVDYAIYQNTPTNLNDPDLILTVTYKNMAALDNLNERTDPIMEKLWGSLQASNAAVAERGKLRTQLGGRLLRQLFLK